jgi:hypothetical protein
MLRLTLASVLVVMAALTVGISAAQAADVSVGLGRCAFLEGGQTTVPAGSTIVVRLRTFEVNRGMVENFLQAQQTTFSLNGGQPIDVSDLYVSPEPVIGGGWSAAILYPTGITLAHAGDSLTVAFFVTVTRNLAETQNGPLSFSEGAAPGPPVFTPAGAVYATGTCTITAA